MKRTAESGPAFILNGFTVLILAYLVGCASHPAGQVTSKSPEEENSAQASFWADQQSRQVELRNVLGKMRLRYETPKDSIGGRGQMLTQGESQARMELRDPLGKLHFLALLDGPKFTAVYPRRKIAYADNRAGALYFQKTLGLEVSFKQIDNLAVGLLPVEWKKNSFDSWKWSSDRKAYVGVLGFADRTVKILVDADRLAMREIVVERSKDPFSLRYEDMASCCGSESGNAKSRFSVAHRMELSSKRRRTSLKLEFDEVSTLEKPKPKDIFEFSVPDGFKKIVLE